MTAHTTIAQYLIQQLENHGIRHVFGIPGDYSLLLIEDILQSPVSFINTSDEQGAGFAADAYARLNGLGALCVTYAVGSLKVANATAQAFAERSPMVVICGAPGLEERARHPRLHHLVNRFDTQVEIFRHLTVAAVALDHPQTAGALIDHALHAAIRFQRPVYIEIPRDLVRQPIQPGHVHQDPVERSDAAALQEAIQEAGAMLAAARQPVIIAGLELHRFGLQGALTHFAEQANIPMVVTMQGKSVVDERHPQYLGVYAGAIGPEDVAQYVETSDCQIILGNELTDMNLGMFTAQLDQAHAITANTDGIMIRHHAYNVRMADFLNALLASPPAAKSFVRRTQPAPPAPFQPETGRAVTVKRLHARLAAMIDEQTVVLADIGDAFFGAIDLPVCRAAGFLGTAYYSNMGFAVPGSLGVQMYDRALRPLVLVGDGAFQMTGMELSTAARYGLNPIVLVLNNQGYATERFFLDGPFNELQPWDFSRVPDVIGAGRGFAVQTEEELDRALHAAVEHTDSFAILDVHLARGDVSDGLLRLGARFKQNVTGAAQEAARSADTPAT